jgi:hypothetical protein
MGQPKRVWNLYDISVSEFGDFSRRMVGRHNGRIRKHWADPLGLTLELVDKNGVPIQYWKYNWSGKHMEVYRVKGRKLSQAEKDATRDLFDAAASSVGGSRWGLSTEGNKKRTEVVRDSANWHKFSERLERFDLQEQMHLHRLGLWGKTPSDGGMP